jgi:geranylgeranyl pyrophosphate synthase
MGWEETLDHYGSLVEEKLEKYFAKLTDEAKAYHKLVNRVYSHLKEFVLRRGKRLASCSTLLTYKGYAGTIDERILKVGVGIELYRHSILIHDDLIDRDSFRRGGKSFHRLLAEGFDRRFGDSVAVFTGDLTYALALQAILNSGFPPDKVEKVVALLAQDYRYVNESQVLDLAFEYGQPDVKEWYTMASKRAASLFRITTLTGAILGEAPEDDLQLLEEAGTNIGYMFDIQDDLIDLFSSPEQYGRPPGGDMARNKKPLYLIFALELADADKASLLKEVVSKKRLSLEDLELVRTLVRESGALEAVRETSKRHAEKVQKLIARTSLSKEVKDFFSSFVDYVRKSLDWYR